MGRLTGSDQEALSRALLELHQPCTLEDFPSRIFSALRYCFSCDVYCFTELHPNGAVWIANEPIYPVGKEIFGRYAHEHPSVNGIVSQKILSPNTISDFATQTERHRENLYNECFRPESLSDQLGFIALHSPPHLAVALSRSTKDFSNEERQLLGLIRPHLVQAYENSRIYSLLGKGLEAERNAFLIVNDYGRVGFSTAGSFAIIEQYFGPVSNQQLPELLRSWFEHCVAHQQSIGASPPRDLIMTGTTGQVTVKYLSQLQTGEHQLLLHEQQINGTPASLQELGLTQREAEVLYWVSQGKRNSEIGIILGTRPRTITKHLERIFEKLGVETRTAATAVALECFRMR